jgi:NAD(P)-dependent dehydrogenase (short-subunit alcohol dehydrogenase family)
MKRIALVTGANRGIGFEACRQLAQRGLRIILTSRDRRAGRIAARRLQDEGLEIVYHVLDVTRPAQVDALREFVETEFGRLDVLVNNAGVYLDEGVSLLDVPLEIVEQTLAVNFYGPLYLTRAFMPLMQRNAYGRVVNVSSESGSLAGMGTSSGTTAAYSVSKAALNALTRLTAGAVRGEDIKVNAMCPGWVRTDMGGPNAPRSVEQGVETLVWLATLPASGPSGGFFRDRRRIPW